MKEKPMTPPTNSVSDEEIARAMNCDKWDADMWTIVNAVTDNDDHMSTEQAIALGLIIAARRAANTPVGPELWGKYPDTGVWHQIADGTNTDEQVADFERCYAEAGWTELRRSNPFASPALPSQVVGDDAEVEMTWRDLALQFDGHRIDALSQLKYAVRCIEEYATVRDILREPLQSLKAFLAAPPLPGEKILADRIQACLTSPAAEPVAWVTTDILAAMKRGERAVPGWKRSDDFCIPLYAGYPAPSASREVTDEMVERVAQELLAHGEFSSIPWRNHDNALKAARAALLAAFNGKS